MLSPKDRLIVALDVPTAVDAQEIIYELGDSVSFYKVGLQLFTAEGPKLVSELVGCGRKVFLDLKLHDIPNTVAGAVKAAAELGVDMLSVHAAGGSKMLDEAIEAANSGAHRPMLLGVTVLTSFNSSDLRETGVEADLREHVLRMAKIAKDAGCRGVVTSAAESSAVRALLGPELAIVTPGIRPLGTEAGDQSRIATPAAAIRAGASHLVVGRPIIGARKPSQVAAAILKEITTTLRSPEMEMAGTRPT